MEKIPNEFIESIKKHSPNIIKYAEYALKNDVNTMIICLDDYEAEPQSLYEVLWYLYDRGISAVIAPEVKEVKSEN